MKLPAKEPTEEEIQAYLARLKEAGWEIASDDEYPPDGEGEATVVFYGPEPEPEE